MAANTNISWATHTWNPWVGCEKVGPACDHCYAEAWAKRAGTPGLWSGDRRRTKTWGDPVRWNRDTIRGASLDRPSIFACSLADWFDNHPDVAPIRADAWKVVRACQAVDWYLVTKRIPNVLKMLPPDWSREAFGHVVIIITVVTQEEADRDVPRLMWLKSQYPWMRVGLSMEPLLGPVDLAAWTTAPVPFVMLDWVIVGGESGGAARPMNPAWARAIRDQCQAAGVPFHFKQQGEFAFAPDSQEPVRLGVAKAGRMLDGQTYDAGPRTVTP
jgi:protein gp37